MKPSSSIETSIWKTKDSKILVEMFQEEQQTKQDRINELKCNLAELGCQNNPCFLVLPGFSKGGQQTQGSCRCVPGGEQHQKLSFALQYYRHLVQELESK